MKASSSSQEKDNEFLKIEKAVSALAKKEFPVRGYFVHYGSGVFDWIYYSSRGKLYKLDGMDEEGYFQWTSLTNYFTNIEVKNGKIILGEAKITREFDSRTLNIIRSIRKQSSYLVNGYFTKYGTDAFDWVYVTGGKLYKLDGMDKNGYFKWLPLTDYFNGIEVQDYTKIKIGESYIKKDISSSFSSSFSSSSSNSSIYSSAALSSYGSSSSIQSSSSSGTISIGYSSIDNTEDFPSY